MKALYDKHLKGCDQKFHDSLPEGLVDKVLALLDDESPEKEADKQQTEDEKNKEAKRPKAKSVTAPARKKRRATGALSG